MKHAALVLGIVVSAALLAAAAVLYTMAGNSGGRAYRGAIEQVRQIQQLSASWSVEIARVKADPLADFDALAAFLPRMARLKERLSDTARAIPALSEHLGSDIRAFLNAIDAQEERVERFKTGYAVVRNSARYLPLAAANVVRRAQASGDGALARSIAALVRNMNLYLSTPSDPAREHIERQVETLREESVSYPPPLAGALSNLLAHTDVLLDRQTPTAALFAEATSSDIAERSERLASSLGFERDLAEMRTANYERGILAAGGVLALFWIGLGFQQRARGGAVSVALPEIDDDAGVDRDREPRIELPPVFASDAGAFEHAPPEAGSASWLAAENAMRHGYLARQVGENLAAAAGRIVTRTEALCGAHERIRAALARSDLMMEVPDAADIEEEIDAGAAITAHARREANVIAGLGKRLTSSYSGLPNGDGERGMVDVNACIAEVVAMTGAERAARISRRLGDLPELFASKTEIRLLLAQVLDNALHAVEELDERAPTIKIDTARREDAIVITVIDNGRGIGAERRAQVFRPFYTSREGAMGLGLTLAGDLVKKYEGAIQVDSLAGRGTVVRITLPVGAPGHDECGPAQPPNRARRRAGAGSAIRAPADRAC
ncbi:MAG: ATP-binding protein [Chromatiales bacterium]|nr:ATP-binding protein [Chromatiales bacterium]